MEENTEKKRKPISSEQTQPVQVIRHGAIAASIWRRQSPAGFAYYDFSISRSWKSLSTGRTGYSSNFFGHHNEELQKTIEEAAAWIEANSIDEDSEKVKEPMAA